MFTNDDSYLQQCVQRTAFQVVQFLPDVLTLILILSSTFLSSKKTVILNSSFKKKIMAPNDPAQSAVFNLHLQFPAALLVSA